MNPDGWQIATDNVRNISRPIYSNWRLYLYNEDDFSFLVLISNKLFSNYKFTSEQKEDVN